jgi:hypothetical protein
MEFLTPDEKGVSSTQMENCIDTTKILLREISPNRAKDLIVKNHYSHKWTMCSVALGVFLKIEPDPNSFFKDDDEKLIGCIVYGNPVGRSAAASISDELKIDEVYELTRLWIADIPSAKNVESYCIGQSFEWLRRNRPKIKALLSYADNEAGHTGVIYQSTNWLYQGNSTLALMPNFSLSLTGPKEGFQWMHSRSVTAKWESCNIEHLKKVIGHTFYLKKESSKHRYIYILLRGKERKRLIKSLKHPTYPYPKEDKFVEEIAEVFVEKKHLDDIEKASFFV